MKIQVIKFPFFLVDVLNFLHNFFYIFLVNAQNVLKKKNQEGNRQGKSVPS